MIHHREVNTLPLRQGQESQKQAHTAIRVGFCPVAISTPMRGQPAVGDSSMGDAESQAAVGVAIDGSGRQDEPDGKLLPD